MFLSHNWASIAAQMGSGISSSRQKAADQTALEEPSTLNLLGGRTFRGQARSALASEVSESVVGQSLASVLSDSDGQTADGSGRLQYPQNVHAAFDVERYVVDENGLRYRDPPPQGVQV